MHALFSRLRIYIVLALCCASQATLASTNAGAQKTTPENLLSAAMAAAAKPLTAQEAANQLVQRHGNYAVTVQLEKDFQRALIERDQVWLDAHAALFRKQDEQMLKASGELSVQEAMAMGQKMGTCHQASTTLYGAIGIAHQKGFAPRGQAVDGQIPINIIREFAKHMAQCESQGQRPPSRRLLGAGQP